MTNQDVGSPRKFGRYYTYIEPVMADPVIKGYFTLIASLLLVAFFIFFALSPTFSTIVGLVRKIDDQKQALASLDKKINNLIIAQESYSQLESDLPILDTALPEKPMPESLLLGVLNSASNSGVTLTSFQINEVFLSGLNPKTVPVTQLPVTTVKTSLISSVGLPTVQFSVGTRGTKAAIRQFSGELQTLPRLIVLTSLSLEKDQLAPNSGDIYISDITGSAFYFPQSK